MAVEISIEVVFAKPDEQALVSLQVPAATSVAAAIRLSGIAECFPGEPIGTLPVGIWGRPARPDQALQDGDRVEVYRPLLLDPRDARRRRALAGQTMGGGRTKPRTL